jgi:hypothetical protein
MIPGMIGGIIPLSDHRIAPGVNGIEWFIFIWDVLCKRFERTAEGNNGNTNQGE